MQLLQQTMQSPHGAAQLVVRLDAQVQLQQIPMSSQGMMPLMLRKQLLQLQSILHSCHSTHGLQLPSSACRG